MTTSAPAFGPSRWLAPATLAAAAFALGLVFSGFGRASDLTRVFVNGRPVPVRFNDGDSFRIMGGEYSGSQCRLAGFNSLESFGPAHQWGDFHPYELYILAKLATINGRRGTWHCFTDGRRDTYGRLLVECPDLIVDSVRRGYAHAYQPDDTPSRPEYLRAQHEAMRARRGIWAHGVPLFVMTSVHSLTEDPTRDWHYDRLISTIDGHSESRQHRNTYSECEWVCNDESVPDPAQIDAVGRSMRTEPSLASAVSSWSNLHLEEFATRFARIGELPAYLEGPARDPILQFLTAQRAAGRLGPPTSRRGSCMLYVDFLRRYGDDRAACLHGHGSVPAHLADRFGHH